ncbi:sulfatase [Verrucomicrobiota bacterium]
MMKTRNLLQTMVAATMLAGTGAAMAAKPVAAAGKPNILLFYVDDLGWMDLGCHGSKFYETPNMDRLAREGVRFTQGYTAHPRCLPARYGVMTGKFPARGGVPGRSHLSPEEFTMAEALQEGGYKTFFAGKWHLAAKHGEAGLPENQGFDVNIAGGESGAPKNYFYPYRKKDVSELPEGWEKGLSKQAIHGLEDGEEGEYLTDRLTDETIKFIKDNKDEPFFAFLSHYAVHTPFQAPEHLIEKYRKKLETMEYDLPESRPVKEKSGTGSTKLRQDNAVYAAMIESVDQSLGRLFDTLEQEGIADNTVVVLTADNGGLSNGGTNTRRKLATSNYPLRTGKGWLYEGGIREAFMVKWPGVTKPGTLNERDVVVGTDLYPTFLEMAGLPLRPQDHVDGVSFVAALKGETFVREKPVFWHSPLGRPYSTGDLNSSAIRKGDYKLLDCYGEDHFELYNVQEDAGENNDLAEAMPEKAQELLKELRDWREEIDALTRPQRWGK